MRVVTTIDILYSKMNGKKAFLGYFRNDGEMNIKNSWIFLALSSSKTTMPLKSSKTKSSSMTTTPFEEFEDESVFSDDQVDPESWRPVEQFKDDHEFQRRLHFREDCVLCRTFTFGKWKVNVFKANHAFEEFEDYHEFQRRLYFREDFISEKIVYSGELFDWEMKSECIQTYYVTC